MTWSLEAIFNAAKALRKAETKGSKEQEGEEGESQEAKRSEVRIRSPLTRRFAGTCTPAGHGPESA